MADMRREGECPNDPKLDQRYNGNYWRWVENRMFGRASLRNLTTTAAIAIVKQNQTLQRIILVPTIAQMLSAR